MKKEDCFQLGYIASTHGKLGELTLRFDVDQPSDYKDLGSILVEFNTDLIPFFIDTIQVRGDKAILRLEDVDTDEQAQDLVGTQIYLPLTSLPILSGNKFYYHEILGYTVEDQKLGVIGAIENVYDNTIQPIFGVRSGDTEILIPVVDEFIINVNRETKTILMDLPDGLIDLYTGL